MKVLKQWSLAGLKFKTHGVGVMEYFVKKTNKKDSPWLKKIYLKYYGGKFCVFLGRKFFLETLPGYYLENEKQKKIGLITYEIKKNVCEIMTLNAFQKFKGIGTCLLKKVIKTAKDNKCKKIKALTTNDNIDALRFYQKRGFRIFKIHKNALKKDRKLKPSIPKLGDYKIPMLDAIELQYLTNTLK